MPKIFVLSNEVLEKIALELYSNDLVSFVLANSLFYDAAIIALRQHRELVKKYSVIDTLYEYAVPNLLLEVLRNPRIGYYVRKLYLEFGFHRKETGFSERDLRLLKRTLRESCLLPEVEYHHRRWEELQDLTPDTTSSIDYQDCYKLFKDGEKAFILGLLLPRLPNLNLFSWRIPDLNEVPRLPRYDSFVDSNAFVTVIRRLSLQTDPPVTPKLRKIIINTLENNDFNLICGLLQVFMAFPSVTCITAEGLAFECRGEQYPEPLAWPETSNLTQLCINSPDANIWDDYTKPFLEMLSRSGSLKTFRFTTLPYSDSSRLDSSSFCVDVLRNLPLLEDVTLAFNGAPVDVHGMSCLSKHEKLRSLETECWILENDAVRHVSSTDFEPIIKLPAYLQQLRLVERSIQEQQDHLETAIELLQCRKQRWLPELQRLDFHLLRDASSSILDSQTRQISFIGRGRGVDVRIYFSDQPPDISIDSKGASKYTYPPYLVGEPFRTNQAPIQRHDESYRESY